MMVLRLSHALKSTEKTKENTIIYSFFVKVKENEYRIKQFNAFK